MRTSATAGTGQVGGAAARLPVLRIVRPLRLLGTAEYGYNRSAASRQELFFRLRRARPMATLLDETETMHGLTTARLGQACRIFMELSYPGGTGTIPPKKQVYYAM